jgi:hypothetical protein
VSVWLLGSTDQPALHEKSGLFENNSRKGAKRYRVFKGFLCALASLREKIFVAEGTFRAKPGQP